MEVYCVFIFDKNILNPLRSQGIIEDRRVEFIFKSIIELSIILQNYNSNLIIRHATASKEIKKLVIELNIDAVMINHDYEPQAIIRDKLIKKELKIIGCKFFSYKDQVIFEKNEILNKIGKPYSIFSCYQRKWIEKIKNNKFYLQSYPVKSYLNNLVNFSKLHKINNNISSLNKIGFCKSNLSALGIQTGMSGAKILLNNFIQKIKNYNTTRNYPYIYGTSYLSIHLRFGTISIRKLVRLIFKFIKKYSKTNCIGYFTWLSQLIWRDFYQMILYCYPNVINKSFKKEYDNILWENNDCAKKNFLKWCKGYTGYPLIDAAIIQLNSSGYMHNKLRMITASFLIKDMGINWKWGENYFANKLNDFDLASNNGNWQWSASSGCSSQPYFRIFNPIIQSKKFDSQGIFIRKYLPQLSKLSNKYIHSPWEVSPSKLEKAGIILGKNYPKPILEQSLSKINTLKRYNFIKKYFKL
ncbi:deoxyribodipyrimidine photo-lyase [Candidatus Profftella armatura (Diaphorina cf. continua)]|uniref:Deoxyribodipyrimidine photo-lyase n=2 Tax=Candidatus Profftella armatura (Diaphorina cf. continua) TaxID=2661583 RepID=A0A7R6VZY5_9PROT|nr:deoxyribodipyrimidine photo-lyase [Candidatus Profftella armatura (Diaphorina cf. continua)]